MTNNFNFAGFDINEATATCFDVPSANNGANQVMHDDGFMHVRVNNVCYSFDIGQEISMGEYNRQATNLLQHIGIQGRVTGSNN